MPEQLQDENKLHQAIAVCEKESLSLKEYSNNIIKLGELLLEEKNLPETKDGHSLIQQAKLVLLKQANKFQDLEAQIQKKRSGFLSQSENEEKIRLRRETLERTVNILNQLHDSDHIYKLVSSIFVSKENKPETEKMIRYVSRHVPNKIIKMKVIEATYRKEIELKTPAVAYTDCLAKKDDPRGNFEMPILMKILLQDHLETLMNSNIGLTPEEAFSQCVIYDVEKFQIDAKLLDHISKAFLKKYGFDKTYQSCLSQTNPTIRVALARTLLNNNKLDTFDKTLPVIISLMNGLHESGMSEESIRKEINLSSRNLTGGITKAIDEYLRIGFDQRLILYNLHKNNREIERQVEDTFSEPKKLARSLIDFAHILENTDKKIELADPTFKQWVLFQKKQAQEIIVNQLYKMVDNLLVTTKQSLSPKYIESKLEENKADHIDFSSESFALRRAAYHGHREQDRHKVTENLKSHRILFIQAIQIATGTLFTVNPDLGRKTAVKILTDVGVLIGYEMCISHPNSVAKIAFALLILETEIQRLNQNQANEVINILAQENPEKVYQYFIDEGKTKKAREIVGIAILKSSKMMSWLFSQSPDNFYKLFSFVQQPLSLIDSKNDNLELIKASSLVFSHWTNDDFDKTISLISKFEAEHTRPTNCARWLHWAKLTNANAMSELKDNDIKVSLDAANVLQLSPEKIKLLDKKARKIFLKTLGAWENERARFSNETADALIHDFTPNDFSWIPPTGLLFLFKKFPNQIIDHITKITSEQNDPSYKNLARILLRELDSGYWKEEKSIHGKVTKSQGLFSPSRIHALVRAGFYKLEDKYDLQADKDNLAENKLLTEDIITNHWQDFLDDASLNALIFFLSSNLIEKINPAQIDLLCEKIIKKIGAKELLAIIERYETKGSGLEIAKRLLGRLPSFILHHENFSREDVNAFMKLLNKAKEKDYDFGFATQAYLNEDKSLSTTKHPILKALNENTSEKKWKLAGVIYGSDPKLLGSFLSQASDHPLSQWSRFLKRTMPSWTAIKWILACTTTGGMISGTLRFLNPSEMFKSSSAWQKLTQWGGTATGVVGGFLASSFLSSALGGLGVTTAGTVLAVSTSVLVGAATGLIFGLATYGIGKGLWGILGRVYQFVTRKIDPDIEQSKIMTNILKYGNPAVVAETLFPSTKDKENKINYEKMRCKIDDMGIDIGDIPSKMAKLDNAVMSASRKQHETFVIWFSRKLAGAAVGWSGSFPWIYVTPRTVLGFTFPWGSYSGIKLLEKDTAAKSNEASLNHAETKPLSPSITVYAALQGHNPVVPLSPKPASSTPPSMDTLTATQLASTTEESKRQSQIEKAKITAQTSRLVREKNAEPRTPVTSPKTPSLTPPGTKKSS